MAAASTLFAVHHTSPAMITEFFISPRAFLLGVVTVTPKTSHTLTNSSILPMGHRESWAQKKRIQAARVPSKSLGGVCATVSMQGRAFLHSQFPSLQLLGEVGKNVPPSRRQPAGYPPSPSALQLFPQEAGNQDLNPSC